ncbi:hypothetical protein [Archangium sp.]|jgi:hypothetical protein|uniref:hypothetical protein n=1 Tax=Archangium sp. TaxID=1872627 RepID=UPI002EDA4372
MADSGAPPSLLDSVRMQALVFEELRRIQRLVGERMPLPGAREGAAEGSEEGEQVELLRRLQGVLLQHPLSAQAAFSALMAEGRRFATTPEGAAWKAALASSELVRNGRLLWDVLSLNLLEEEQSTVVPSAYLEALFRAASSSDVEALLRRLRDASARDGHGAP